ncbi:MAG TPA: NAD(P)/FAD-dependent oxidoreductase [Planctomycetota bacterium]|nr:NAD(P)/FAD-dependent oxidoreductase [Planctomycetota bacterium]
MNRHLRRALTGAVAGVLASPILAVTTGVGGPLAGVALALLVGPCFVLVRRPVPRVAIDALMEAATFGVPLWAMSNVVVLPLLAGEEPRWTAAAMREVFPALVGWILFQAVLGVLAHALDGFATRRWGPEQVPPVPVPPKAVRIVILGGGFAGVSTAERLESLFGASPEIELTIVSETNALLFTPMLAEVAASSLEATHITSPLRTGLRRTTVVRGTAVAIDLGKRSVRVERALGVDQEIGYDHLVLALGAVSNYLGMAGVEAHAFDFKSLADAIRIRNHVIDCFERADVEQDAEERRRLLTFVIAGGGFAGAELTGGLNDFVRGMLPFYPNIPRDELQVVLVHGGQRILNELGEPLALYAQRSMARRGVTFRLGTRLRDATADRVVLSDGELSARTLVWTAGTAPHPLLKTLGVELDKRGAVLTEQTLRVRGHDDVWALGDAAAIPNPGSDRSCPPTAQFAIREARQLAANVQAVLRGKAPRPFRFSPLGALCVVGHHTACAEIKGLRFSGLFAWLMWRAIYLSKLPSLERKVRVLGDWTIEVFFPRDIVQTIDLDSDARGER